jgi:arylsulfatase A-like enzyme
VAAPSDIDGISLLPALVGGRQRRHEYLYWEHARKLQAVRIGDWKAVRLSPAAEIELYDLKTDVAEQKDVAATHRTIVEQARRIMSRGRTESTLFPLADPDAKAPRRKG